MGLFIGEATILRVGWRRKGRTWETTHHFYWRWAARLYRRYLKWSQRFAFMPRLRYIRTDRWRT